MSEDIDAFVTDNGEGHKVALMMTPEQRKWQFVSMSPDDARVLAAKLTRAAKLAERNEPSVEIAF